MDDVEEDTLDEVEESAGNLNFDYRTLLFNPEPLPVASEGYSVDLLDIFEETQTPIFTGTSGDDESFTIFIKNLDGSSVPLEVMGSYSVGFVKDIIH